MHRKTSKKFRRLVLAPGAMVAVVSVVIYFQVDAAQAERRAIKSRSARPTAQQQPGNLVQTPPPPLNVVDPTPYVAAGEAEPANGNESSETPSSSTKPLTAEEAQRRLQAELMWPWMRQAIPEHRLMSRAAPRISVKPTFDLDNQLSGTFLGVVSLQRYREHQNLPVAIDRYTGRIFVFAGERWQTPAQWLKTDNAPPKADKAPLKPSNRSSDR